MKVETNWWNFFHILPGRVLFPHRCEESLRLNCMRCLHKELISKLLLHKVVLQLRRCNKRGNCNAPFSNYLGICQLYLSLLFLVDVRRQHLLLANVFICFCFLLSNAGAWSAHSYPRYRSPCWSNNSNISTFSINKWNRIVIVTKEQGTSDSRINS